MVSEKVRTQPQNRQRDAGRNRPNSLTDDLEEDTSQTKLGTKPSRQRFSFFIPRPPRVFVAYPANFLSSMGTSPKADMSHLGYRLASLNGLPPSCDIFRVRLAQTGFYYDNSKTTRDASNVHEVVCYSCGITFSQWQKGDNPTTIHQNLRPDCDHLKSITADTTRTGNISSNSSPDGASSGASSGFWPISGSSSGPSSPFGYSSTMSCLSRDSSMQQSSRSSSDSGLGSGFGTGADASLRVPAHTELQADGAERRNDGG